MSESSEYTFQVRRSDGSIDIGLLATTLDVTEAELAASVGLSGRDSQEAQGRLNELVKILEAVMPWAGNPQGAFHWYCFQPIAGFGGKTANDMVQAGRVSAVEAHLEGIVYGGYA